MRSPSEPSPAEASGRRAPSASSLRTLRRPRPTRARRGGVVRGRSRGDQRDPAGVVVRVEQPRKASRALRGIARRTHAEDDEPVESGGVARRRAECAAPCPLARRARSRPATVRRSPSGAAGSACREFAAGRARRRGGPGSGRRARRTGERRRDSRARSIGRAGRSSPRPASSSRRAVAGLQRRRLCNPRGALRDRTDRQAGATPRACASSFPAAARSSSRNRRPRSSSSSVKPGLVRVDVNRVGIHAHEQVGAPVAAIEARLEADRQQEQRHVGGDERRMFVRRVAAREVRTHAIEAVAGRRDLRVRVRHQGRPRLPCRGHANPGGGDLGAQTGPAAPPPLRVAGSLRPARPAPRRCSRSAPTPRSAPR